MSSRLLFVLAMMVLTGCSGASSPLSTAPLSHPVPITPGPEPTPTPKPSPWSSGWPEGGLDVNWEVKRDLETELSYACWDGTPVPGAAPYAGQVHPLVVMDMDSAWMADVDINQDFVSTGWPWPSPIQLVVCARSEEKVVGSCGSYKSEGGVVGEVVPYQETMTLRVIVVATGKALQKKVIKNPVAKCPKTVALNLIGEWAVRNPVTPKQVNAYAMTVSKQAVK